MTDTRIPNWVFELTPWVSTEGTPERRKEFIQRYDKLVPSLGRMTTEQSNWLEKSFLAYCVLECLMQEPNGEHVPSCLAVAVALESGRWPTEQERVKARAWARGAWIVATSCTSLGKPSAKEALRAERVKGAALTAASAASRSTNWTVHWATWAERMSNEEAGKRLTDRLIEKFLTLAEAVKEESK